MWSLSVQASRDHHELVVLVPGNRAALGSWWGATPTTYDDRWKGSSQRPAASSTKKPCNSPSRFFSQLFKAKNTICQLSHSEHPTLRWIFNVFMYAYLKTINMQMHMCVFSNFRAAWMCLSELQARNLYLNINPTGWFKTTRLFAVKGRLRMHSVYTYFHILLVYITYIYWFVIWLVPQAPCHSQKTLNCTMLPNFRHLKTATRRCQFVSQDQILPWL